MIGNTMSRKLKKSAIPGVTIAQFVEDVPKGCTTPDFERKPITLTLSEGKNAIFRAVVKGEPKPEVLWKRSTGKIDDPDRYQTTFIPGTNEFTLQINKITQDDADVYRFTAVNDYGEAACSAGLKIIQGKFHQLIFFLSFTIWVSVLGKNLRTPKAAQKKEIDPDQVWQLLLNADKKDYEKICLKYGIVDFRGMLRQLQEMKKEREDKQAQYVYSIANLKHVRVNQEQANASFDVEMELKNLESRIYLYKDGEMVNFRLNDDNVKHCLRQVGKKYNFIINDLQPEDAGVYQIKIEDVDIFSTELEAENIPVYFRYPLDEARCHEQGNAVFQCTLYEPCFNAVWFHKKNQLKPNDKYEISVSNDGLTHHLVIKNAQPSDKGTYTIDIGRRTSSAWLDVEYLDGVSIKKEGQFHKLIIDEVQDKHAGKYKFEAEGVRTEASIFVEDPPNVNSELLEKLKKEPIVVKAGKNAIVKIPFEGQKPIRSSWLKDEGELLDDARINTEYSDNYTRLCISSANRKDCGDYKVKLRNESGSTEATFKLIVIDKPQPPTGPIEVVESSTSGITIQWKPPRDDGGKPIQSYVIERQQVGRKTWVTLGETTGNSTIFTTNKVEQDKRYYFRVRAVNAEGTSEVLESDEVMAASKVFPGPPAPPKIISANRGAITLSWAAPHKTGNSRILGYTVEKSKKGSNTWIPVTDLPITEKKYTVTDLKEGLQYEFRVAAINSAGTGEASAPSEAVFARDPMQPPGPVKDLKVVNTDYCSISLSWTKPGTEEESPVKGYIVEMRHTDMLKWTQCNALPIPMTAYIVRGLKPREMYFLRVRAVNDGGFGEPVELDSYVQTIPPIVQPKVLVKDTVKSFMIVKAGDTIRVRIPFEASPPPEVHWLKDGHVLTAKATTATREGVSQLIIPAADFSDSGHYSIVLQSEHGKKETFSFLVQVLDVPEAPGPIQLVERVPDTVTLMWEPSPTEKRDRNLNYMVMRRDSSKGSWNMVADLIYTNKCTVANFVPGRDYFFRVLAKNYMGVSEPSETVQPWSIHKERDYSQNETLKWRLDPGKKGGPKMLYSLTNHCKENCSQLLQTSSHLSWAIAARG
uniref:Immunoglobulin like and fibronectin type III domain containing 1, tandem duplicate 2 n=1 Tax=Anolis carolinensis TaxID=28377 RepID=G1KBY4_ANOCA